MNICENCFNDLEIKKFIETTSQVNGVCGYCEVSSARTIDLNELLDFFSGFIDVFITNNEQGIPLNELINRDWRIFSSDAHSDKLLNEILGIIPSKINSADTPVSYIDEIVECVDYWDILKEDVKWKRRFLTDSEAIKNLGWDTFFTPDAGLPKDKTLYRARIHSSDNQYTYPLDKMGSPPKKQVTSGRANPDGIPFLYLSADYKTTLYETRVTYLDDVSIGSFKLRDVKELILVDFNSSESPFLQEDSIKEHVKYKLLKEKISLDLSKPIRRYDSQLEYLPTQFICEFIRYIKGADGIIFNSSLHKGGINYVIFDSEKLECIGVEKYQVTSVVIEGEKI
jgi:hypothetical protein